MPCAAVSFAGESRSRPPPRTAYIKGSRARPRAHTPFAPHQHPARPPRGPRGGPLPQLRPPRSASASTMIHSGEAISGALITSTTPSCYRKSNPLLNFIFAAPSDKTHDCPNRRPPELGPPSTQCSPASTAPLRRRRALFLCLNFQTRQVGPSCQPHSRCFYFA